MEGLSTCPFHTVGQEFAADYAKPDGFCDEACTEEEKEAIMRFHNESNFMKGLMFRRD